MPDLNICVLIADRSDPLMPAACQAAFSLADCMDIGLSPLAIYCNAAWGPLLARLSERYGYCWEFVTNEPTPAGPYYSPQGEAVLTKVVR